MAGKAHLPYVAWFSVRRDSLNRHANALRARLGAAAPEWTRDSLIGVGSLRGMREHLPELMASIHPGLAKLPGLAASPGWRESWVGEEGLAVAFTFVGSRDDAGHVRRHLKARQAAHDEGEAHADVRGRCGAVGTHDEPPFPHALWDSRLMLLALRDARAKTGHRRRLSQFAGHPAFHETEESEAAVLDLADPFLLSRFAPYFRHAASIETLKERLAAQAEDFGG